VRSVDTVARLGGDEFVVMLEQPRRRAGAAGAQRGRKILSTLSMPYPLQGYQYRSTPSIGIAPFTGTESTTVSELLKQADLAMYQAKRRAQHPALL
jgi:diguanylate cyclase (GGDEF)-like protein